MLRVDHFHSNNNAQKAYSFKLNVTYIERATPADDQLFSLGLTLYGHISHFCKT
jgi:hypothetical protein